MPRVVQTSSPVLVVGLGNPGNEYAKSRHNLGFMALEELAARSPAGAFKAKFSGAFAKCQVGGRDAILLRPETYMNESGRSVQPAAAFFHVATSDVVVIHDELDLPLGDVRIKLGGGHAGHNGLRSVTEHLGAAGFVRVRMGIGRPPVVLRGNVADYVLAPFGPAEHAQVTEMVKRAADAVEKLVALGVDRAMLEMHTRATPSAGARGNNDDAPPAVKKDGGSGKRASASEAAYLQ